MRKFYARTFIAKKFLFLLVAAVSVLAVKAQTDITIGTGTVGNAPVNGYPCPLQDYFEGSRAQYLFRASELTAAGMGPGNINAIKFNVISVGTAGVVEQYTLKINTTTVSTLDLATWEPGAVVKYGPVNYQPVAGINTFTFSTPFFWNGTDNIIVEPCNGPVNPVDGDFTVNPVVPWTTGLTFNASHTYRADNLGNLCATTTTTNTGTATTRPNIVFTWTPAIACTGVPVAGTAVASPTTVCLGQSIALTLTGASVASGLTYQWQSSPDGATNWTDISGATSSTLTTSQSATTYYRAIDTTLNIIIGFIKTAKPVQGNVCSQ